MKQKLVGVILALNALIVGVQARFYLGVNADYNAQVMRDSQKNNRILSIHPSGVIADSLHGNQTGYGIAIVLGAEDFYSRYFGTRYGIGAGYTTLKQSKLIDTELSFDFLLDFFNNRDYGFGIFGGVGLKYYYQLAQKEHFLNLDGRVGVSILVLANHRIEGYAKLPIASIKVESNSSLLARTTFGASYKIIF